MFTYINENFLHAPSKDLSRETVKTLIVLMLAQAQEVFVEKQIADGRKVGLLAKLASQAALLYTQASEGAQENVSRGVFDRVWLLMTQVKANYMSSIAQFYQALADDDANSHGTAIARLQIAEREGKDACRIANAFPSAVSPASNLSLETRASLLEMTTRITANVQEKLAALNKDNDFIYHQTIPAEASLTVVPKLAAAKAIPVSELYQGQDIQRIIGPDIFQKIVPMAVTESASLYDEEKAKLVRAEVEKVEIADGEMAASLDYLKLPGSLTVLKGGMDQEITVDNEFQTWCEDLAGHKPFEGAFESLQSDKTVVLNILTKCSRSLDQEESTCEKMRSKYGGDWTQQPSSRLTPTLRSDIRSYRSAVEQASTSDAQLSHVSRQYESDFDEMRSAGETQEADVLYQQAMVKAGASRGKGRNGVSSPASGGEASLLDEDFGEGGTSVMDQIIKVEELLRKLELVKRDRAQIVKDLKEKVRSSYRPFRTFLKTDEGAQVHNDDISNVLILNKKSISSLENQLFQTELDKFRPHQNRLLQANHKQTALMKELTRIYSALLQDKRVKSEQTKYENFTKQRSMVMIKYKKVFQAFKDLIDGLSRAQSFYSEMKETVESLEKNVETFVNNRRSEGAQLLNQIEQGKQHITGNHADRERGRLRDLMERMSTDPLTPSLPPRASDCRSPPGFGNSRPSEVHFDQDPPMSTSAHSHSAPNNHDGSSMRTPDTNYLPFRHNIADDAPTTHDPYRFSGRATTDNPYNPMTYPYQTPASLPSQHHYSQQSQISQQQQQQQQNQYQHLPHGYIPPPPPPGPPPNLQGNHGYSSHANPPGPGGYATHQPPRLGNIHPQQSQNDPWAGLNSWK